jgi:glycerophosphoryl diester phosphodiesterase
METPTPETEHPWVRRSRRAGRPLIFAHRGGAGLAPENTWPAFEEAHALGVDGFELDVHVSRDGEVVVIHDADLRRTTGRDGRVSAMTADELSQADAGFRFTPSDPPVAVGMGEARASTPAASAFPFRGRGVKIPRLRDLLAAFPDELFIIELKGTHPRVALRTLAVVREANALDRVCFGGFSGTVLKAARFGTDVRSSLHRRDPHVCSSAGREETRWALYGSWIHVPMRWLRSRGVRAFQVPEMSGNTRVVSPRFVEMAHAAGLLVQVWTVNEEADMRRLAEWGIDGLITDRPDRAMQLWPSAASTVAVEAGPSRPAAASPSPQPHPAAAGAASRQSGTTTR